LLKTMACGYLYSHKDSRLFLSHVPLWLSSTRG